MRARGDKRLSDRQADALAGPRDDGSFARQMQIHLRSFIRLARTTLLRAEIAGGASLCGHMGPRNSAKFLVMCVPRQALNLMGIRFVERKILRRTPCLGTSMGPPVARGGERPAR